jgi:uncharacterized protein YndB with AHSA1/START domain
MELVSDRRYRFAADPDDLWSALAATGDYQRWWPWLRVFDAEGLTAGGRWRCAVRPPLPYMLRFTIHLDEVDRPRRIAAHLAGDIAGIASVEITPSTDGCVVRLTSTLAPSSRLFAGFATIARPIVRRGHDWVIDTGAAQFAGRALTRREEPAPTGSRSTG